VTSVGCGWRKPAPEAFERVAADLDADPAALCHVGDDPETDGGVRDVGGRFVDVRETPLSDLDRVLDGAREGSP